jgi:hypothetical protein
MKNYNQSLLNNEDDHFLAATTPSAQGTLCVAILTFIPNQNKDGNASLNSLHIPKAKSKRTPFITTDHTN